MDLSSPPDAKYVPLLKINKQLTFPKCCYEFILYN